MAEFVCDATHRGGRMRMRFLAEREMRDRIALEAVGSALQEYEFRLRLPQVVLDLAPFAISDPLLLERSILHPNLSPKRCVGLAQHHSIDRNKLFDLIRQPRLVHQ
jgi:hypothetical protein